MLALGVLTGVLWWVLAPRSSGLAVSTAVSYPNPDSPPAQVAAWFVIVTAAAGLLVGVPCVALADARTAGRTARLILAGVPASCLAYAVGFLLGPAPIAAQLAGRDPSAGPTAVQVPLLLPTPLLVLAWPTATALLATVGLLLAVLILPRPPDWVLSDGVLSGSDRGDDRPGEAGQIGGGQFDVEPAPTGTDQHGREL